MRPPTPSGSSSTSCPPDDTGCLRAPPPSSGSLQGIGNGRSIGRPSGRTGRSGPADSWPEDHGSVPCPSLEDPSIVRRLKFALAAAMLAVVATAAPASAITNNYVDDNVHPYRRADRLL